MRQEGVEEAAIAAALGIDRKIMWERIARWNTRYPEQRIPLSAARARPTKKSRILALYAEGLAVDEIVKHVGGTKGQTSKTISRARATGEVGSRTENETDGWVRWQRYSRKGAVREQGRMSDILRQLTPKQLDQLLDQRNKTDATLSAVMARIIRGHLDGQP
jgi:hypothetical protein